MLTTKEQKRVADEISYTSNVIGKGSVLKGDVVAAGNLRIDGTVEGNINSQAKVAIGQTGKIVGNLQAVNADIEGEVNGNLSISEILVLKASSVINGDVATAKLTIEPGVIFNGNCRMTNVTSINE